MHYIWIVVIGFIVGLVARAIHPGRDKIGFIMTILLGIAGAFVANFIGQAVGWYRPGDEAGFIASVIGAIVLLAIYAMVKR